MIEKMFPQTVSNIIDYDAIKAAAKKYVEDVFVEIVKSFGDNLILQTMDEAHLSEVSKHVAGDSGLSVEDLLSYMNTDNIYRESEFVSDLLTAFPSGVEYLEFEVTGWKFPQVDFLPFNDPDRSYNYDGTPVSGAGDDVWMDNAFNGDYVNNLLLSRYKGQFGPNNELNWHKKSGRRSSWGDAETWMTTGGFGKPASIHINVDEERTVLEENGLSSVENWLGTVANKLPINLYIEINDIFKANGVDTAGSTNGYRQSFPYAEGEGFCTNDPAMAVSPNVAPVTYTVSYVTTQLPDVQIELPESEIVEDGYSIILPTMTGKYESGGKTWSPTSWDIGAFGSSYTPSADTVAHLIFEEVETYEEITLYMGGENRTTQNLITSSFTGDVNSAAVTQLFYDAECTDPFVYDYSNDYEVGRYVDGVWTPRVNRVSDMPSSTTPTLSAASFGFIIYDTGGVWIFTNFSGTWLYNGSPIIVRIYPKAQQHYPAYFNSNNAYTNNIFTSTVKVVYFSPTAGASARFFGHYIADNGTLADVLDSGGSSVKKVGDGLNASSVSGKSYLRLEQSSSVSRSARVMTFTLPHPTFIGWLHVDHTDQSVTMGTVKRLLDNDGNFIEYSANIKYIAVCIFSMSNSIGDEAILNGQYCIGSDDTYPGELCFKQIYTSITANRIWVAMETVNNYIWAYFTSSGSATGTNTPQTSGEVYPLYDENGAPILYDVTKQYETLEVQYIANGKYLMRGNVRYSSYEGDANGQLQCTATATNSIGAKRIKVWIKSI